MITIINASDLFSINLVRAYASKSGLHISVDEVSSLKVQCYSHYFTISFVYNKCYCDGIVYFEDFNRYISEH